MIQASADQREPTLEHVDPDRVELIFSTSTLLSGPDEDSDGLAFWSVFVEVVPDNEVPGQPRRTIGRANVVVVDAMCPDPWDACDAQTAALSNLAAMIWTAEAELRPEVVQLVEDLGQDVLLLDTFELDADIRGQGLGLLCAAEIIRVLGRGCGIVAAQAMPMNSSKMSEFERRRGSAALVKLWTQLGLELVPGHDAEGMLIGDLSMREIGDARASLRAADDLE